MKKLILIILAIITVSVASAETNNDGAYPANKHGFNYKKHHRHNNFVKFCNKAFNRNGCRGYKFH
jgi:hypothetical protein